MFKTVAYADVFDYPLTKKEVHRWLIKGDSFASAKVSPYWNYLPGRAELVALRHRREKISQKKWPGARRAAAVLAFIPWIKMIAVTGALAMNNTNIDDDIDLMIITATNRLWLTRLIVSLLLWPHLRGGRMDSSKVADRICINLWLDETALTLKQQDLYIAHELCQAKPLLDRDNCYQKFITANLWYKQFLPNWTP